MCWSCGSLERHREIGVLFRRRPMLSAGMSVLHIAPEPAIRKLLPKNAEYTAGDLEPGPGQLRIDVTSMQFADDSFDVLFCNHVMEHVPNDRAAMREFRRVLRPGGWGTVMTPIVTETTDEDPSVTDPGERLRRFGQRDHVRRYGWDYVDRLEEAGFEVDVIRDFSGEEAQRHGLTNLEGFVEPLFLIRKPERR
jgi:SAM-dependent methyltransferase